MWAAPLTWATGDVVRASTLNTEWRDNLLALSGHDHTGDAGDGFGPRVYLAVA